MRRAQSPLPRWKATLPRTLSAPITAAERAVLTPLLIMFVPLTACLLLLLSATQHLTPRSADRPDTPSAQHATALTREDLR